MNYLTQQLLNAEEINLIKKDLEDETQNWEDGGKTAAVSYTHLTLPTSSVV